MTDFDVMYEKCLEYENYLSDSSLNELEWNAYKRLYDQSKSWLSNHLVFNLTYEQLDNLGCNDLILLES